MGVNVCFVTLHVSLGTFRPVKVDNIEEHQMHTEEFHVPIDVCEKVNKAKDTAKQEGRLSPLLLNKVIVVIQGKIPVSFN